MSKNVYGGVDPYVVYQSKFYALKLVRNNFYSFNDLDDLIQEFIMFYLKYKGDYDSNRSSFKHWLKIIFKNFYNDLEGKAKCRNRIVHHPNGELGEEQTEEDLLFGESSFLCL
ncbi:hypothetical protein FACS1894152_4970 [Bacilli bacterium]|nr:hypothetical protein FACS1894152_4970 [Bacilli bacterium]